MTTTEKAIRKYKNTVLNSKRPFFYTSDISNLSIAKKFKKVLMIYEIEQNNKEAFSSVIGLHKINGIDIPTNFCYGEKYLPKHFSEKSLKENEREAIKQAYLWICNLDARYGEFNDRCYSYHFFFLEKFVSIYMPNVKVDFTKTRAYKIKIEEKFKRPLYCENIAVNKVIFTKAKKLHDIKFSEKTKKIYLQTFD